ncbi:hypothetical protein [Streptomyces sp. NPDC059639]|uniref:hypothetical protein n=1 Tax=Streptomyces sp. NPDC059639 TaxID=3346891 RepID=UPI0036959A4B
MGEQREERHGDGRQLVFRGLTAFDPEQNVLAFGAIHEAPPFVSGSRSTSALNDGSGIAGASPEGSENCLKEWADDSVQHRNFDVAHHFPQAPRSNNSISGRNSGSISGSTTTQGLVQSAVTHAA